MWACVTLRCKNITIMRKYKSASFVLPISKNAYKRFVERICELLADDAEGAEAMLGALDSYLAGDDAYADGLAAAYRLAFGVLRQDVDLAKARSAKARMRAAKRVGERQCGDAMPNDGEAVAVEETDVAAETLVRPLSRRERRARERAGKPKARFGRPRPLTLNYWPD